MVKNLRVIYQLKITLIGIRPPIWRRILITSTSTLYNLHIVLQEVMPWRGCHLHCFNFNGVEYSSPDIFDTEPSLAKDDAKIKLSAIFKTIGDKVHYVYDYGDNWEHNILLEKILPFKTEQLLPICITGKRACPPEDCGGRWGYRELLEIFHDPTHPEYAEIMSWLPEDFDPEFFDKDFINHQLHGAGYKT